MSGKLFDRTIVQTAEQAVDFIGNILESSTEYSIIGKDLEGRILLWNEGARRLYRYEPEEVVGNATSLILHTPQDRSAVHGPRGRYSAPRRVWKANRFSAHVEGRSQRTGVDRGASEGEAF